MATMKNPSSFFSGGGTISGDVTVEGEVTFNKNLSLAGDLDIDQVIIGKNANAVDDATAVGLNAKATGNSKSAAFGRDSEATGSDATALGTAAVAPAQWNTVVGYDAGGASNGQNVVIVGRKAEATGKDGVALGETAKANADDATAVGWGAESTAKQASVFGYEASTTGQKATAVGDSATVSADGATALGRNATASATGAVAIGKDTTVSQSDTIGIGSRDFELADGNNLTYPDGVSSQVLADKSQDGSIAAGTNVGYDLQVDGTNILRVFAESDGAGGLQNESVTIPVDLIVNGQTTQVDNLVTGDVKVEDGMGNVLVRFDATASPKVIDFNNNVSFEDKVLFGSSDEMSMEYGSTADSMLWEDKVNGEDRMELDRTSGNLSIEGSFTEGAAL